MSYISTATGFTITNYAYNYIQNTTNSILGLGPQGWGIGSQNSSQVTTQNRVRASQWTNLIADINFIQTHITNATTSSVAPTTTDTISASLPNALGPNMDYLSNDLRRYVCHPNQFYGYPGETVNTLNGTSTRTTLWGREISQRVRVDWPTNLFARYFFNSGSVFTWRPTYTSSATPNDRDEEWADFIDYLKAGPAYEYTRADFLDGSSSTKTTTYNSGSLTVTIVALRDGDINTAKRVDFTATFLNEDLGYLTVDPERGYWNYGPWETP
jgi:hypothetical protein